MELAAADVKPGTPPDTAHAPFNYAAPASAPAVEDPTAGVAPAPVPVPAPAPPAGPVGKAVVHNGESGVKEAFNAKAHAALGTAAAATIVGGEALTSATLAASLTALIRGWSRSGQRRMTSRSPAWSPHQ